MPSTPATPADHTPVDDFAQCHVGIVAQLRALGELPALLEPARRARQIATQALSFFRDAVVEHHAEEERELFPAVLASAVKGEERDKVRALAEALTAEHRRIEAEWSRLEPGLKAVAKGHDADLDAAAVGALVSTYLAHAGLEEKVFLPLAQTILGRNSNHMAALGMSMHMRHVLPEVMQRFAGRV